MNSRLPPASNNSLSFYFSITLNPPAQVRWQHPSHGRARLCFRPVGSWDRKSKFEAMVGYIVRPGLWQLFWIVHSKGVGIAMETQHVCEGASRLAKCGWCHSTGWSLGWIEERSWVIHSLVSPSWLWRCHQPPQTPSTVTFCSERLYAANRSQNKPFLP